MSGREQTRALSADAEDAPEFTVAVCTWNRAARLRRALESHAAARVPENVRWEMVVVDNGSTDETAAVLAEFATRLPLRCVVEPRLGLSYARNAAVDAARGCYMLWTDDDVLVSPEWVAGYARAVRAWPGAVVFGGPIAPLFEPDPPAWLVRALPVVGNALALLDYGAEPVPFGGERLPYGANYAVRTAVQREFRYHPWLGRKGTNMAGGEEWAVIAAMLAAGGTGWYVPWVPVRHLVAAERQQVRYLRGYYVGGARAAFAGAGDGDAAPTLLGRPRWAWRQAVQHELLYHLTRHVAPSERWTRHLRQASSAWGILSARRPSARERRARGCDVASGTDRRVWEGEARTGG